MTRSYFAGDVSEQDDKGWSKERGRYYLQAVFIGTPCDYFTKSTVDKLLTFSRDREFDPRCFSLLHKTEK